MSTVSSNIVWHTHQIDRTERERLNGHRGAVVWFTGLSGSGKSTLAGTVEALLFERNVRTYMLDGDNVRYGLNRDLGFSPEDREENIRRIGEVAKLFADAGMVTFSAFISPYRSDRDNVRQAMWDGGFIEVYVRCPVEVCSERDPKGLYKKAIAGEITDFTGISAPYEEPLAPELVVETHTMGVEESAEMVIRVLEEAGIIPKA